MEKKAFRIGILAGVLAGFLFSLSSCTFEITEKKRIADPDVINTSNGITITLKNSNSDTMHINIFRQDVTTVINENYTDVPVINIGIVFPYLKGTSTNNTTFVYEDTNVIKNRKYRYCARLYNEGDGYTYTNWTSPIKATNGINSNTSRISYGIPQTAKFIYDSSAKTITISGNIVNPTGMEEGVFEETFKPAFVFASKDETRVFEIESIEDKSVVYLGTLLPYEFFDTKLTFLGIIGQRIDYYTILKTKETKIQGIIWTELTTVPPEAFVDKDGNSITNKEILLESEYGQSGYDYSFYDYN
jgi:hypothetical protein